MPATRRFVLDLPEDAAAVIDAHVADGGYAGPSEAVAAAVLEFGDAHARIPPAGVAEAAWDAFALSVRETAARIDAGVERTHTDEDVRAELARRREARADRR